MKIAIVSGYYNPLHLGHIKMMQSAKELADYLICIVNNDKQQIIKKGKVIMGENERFEIIQSIKYVNEAIISIDEDKTVCKTLKQIANKYPNDELIFCNGGDRKDLESIPEANLGINIKFEFGIGGFNKINSSSNINELNKKS